MKGLGLLLLLGLGACATTDSERMNAREEAPPPASTLMAETGRCKPFFISPTKDDPENVPRHSCWNRLWEVPLAVLIAPVALAAVTSPIWVPLVLLP